MTHYKIVCICQVYNELRKGNLERFIKHIKRLVDALVVYDDGSTDGSYEYLLKETPYLIRSPKNDFINERSHKQLLLQEALKLSPDFILWMDVDEVLTANADEKLQELCERCAKQEIDGVNFHEINIWRSHTWKRVDSPYDSGWFCRLWRVVPEIAFHDTKPGLHQPLFPSTIRNAIWENDIQVLHYGFSSKQRIAHKYLVYKTHGQRGYDMLDRLISEEKLTLERIPKTFFPEELWCDDEEPRPLSFKESFAYVEEYKPEVFRPKFTIACLIYKSVEWLKFVYEQVFKYTDMSDKEFFFVANDANEAVLNYLQENYIPHYVLNHTPEQRDQWYVNNVYRAYNYAADKAKGDFLVFINSDMAFTPHWLDNLWKAYNGGNCITSRLVESGKLPSGQHAIEINFGRDYSTYQEKDFQRYAQELENAQVLDGGLFMPMLIRKEHFQLVGGYPEGQVRQDSDIYHPVIAKHGEPCISGDTVLMMKLREIGVKHQTVFNSLVYHFQWGELDSRITPPEPCKPKVAICNNQEKVVTGQTTIWNQLVNSLPSCIGVDLTAVGNHGDFAVNARRAIQVYHPEVRVIIQNASFMDTVNESCYTIVLLQDDLRSQGQKNEVQEENLRRAKKRVTPTLEIALAYPEYDFTMIPNDEEATQKWHALLLEAFQELKVAKLKANAEGQRHKVSIVITTYKRTNLLRWGLYSLSLQNIPFDFETIVVNDGIEDETEAICHEFKEKLNLRYIFAGQRNLKGDQIWRVPGFAINIGVKQATGDILVLCCAEMYHVNNTIENLIRPILNNPKLLVIPEGKDDREGAFLEHISKYDGSTRLDVYNRCSPLDTSMPFLMAMHRNQFMEIGGYDEDFVGIAYDDRDIIDRLLGYGCRHYRTSASTVHLYHPRAQGYYQGGGPQEWDYNKNLFFSRRGKIIRNQGKEWGNPD